MRQEAKRKEKAPQLLAAVRGHVRQSSIQSAEIKGADMQSLIANPPRINPLSLVGVACATD